MTSLDGVSWNDAVRGKAAGTYGDVPVHFIGRQEFLVKKRAVGRQIDLADIEALEGHE